MTYTTIRVRVVERNWLEKLKRKHKLADASEVVKKLRKMCYKLKLEEEIR